MHNSNPNFVHAISSDRLSTLRTLNHMERLCVAKSVEDACKALEYAKLNDLLPFILGNGSNVFFANKVIKRFVIKNELPSEITELPDGDIWCSSGTPVIQFLRFCLSRSLDAPYFLASLPAQIGGALAMNAGRGGEDVIYKYVKSVTFVKDARIVTVPAENLDVSERHTTFLDNPGYFIVGATFHLPVIDLQGDPIADRISWSRKYQDHSAPNVGCFFSKRCDKYILFLCASVFRWGKARFSRTNKKWLLNNSKNPGSVRRIVKMVRVLCAVTFRQYGTEVRIVY